MPNDLRIRLISFFDFAIIIFDGGRVKPVLSGMHEISNDIPKILPLACISLEKKFKKER
jgi:hypothetical protein